MPVFDSLDEVRKRTTRAVHSPCDERAVLAHVLGGCIEGLRPARPISLRAADLIPKCLLTPCLAEGVDLQVEFLFAGGDARVTCLHRSRPQYERYVQQYIIDCCLAYLQQ